MWKTTQSSACIKKSPCYGRGMITMLISLHHTEKAQNKGWILDRPQLVFVPNIMNALTMGDQGEQKQLISEENFHTRFDPKHYLTL